VSDDLGMKAVTLATPQPEAAVRAIEAGCDTVLLCNSTVDEQVQVFEALIRAAEFGRLTPARLDDAFRRQHDVKARLAAAGPLQVPTVEMVGSARHRDVAREMARWL
jgi:beta-N-acetylhexosaminidase